MTTTMGDGETSAGIIRGLGLFVPLFAVVLAGVLRPPPPARIGAAILASAWAAAALPFVNLLAVRQDWWSFHAVGGTAAGLPVDLMLGWVLLWGTLPALARFRLSPAVLGLVSLDLALMPLLQPVVVLGPHWLLGEALAVVVALLPALLLASWTERDLFLAVRVLAQMALAAFLFLALPVVVLGVALPSRFVLGVGMQVLAVPLLVGVVAVREFAVIGGGTPLPYDPPRRLVTSGPYMYVRNPMQLSMALAYLVLAVVFWDVRLLVGALVVVTYSAGLAAWHEGDQLERAYGPEWVRYRSAVRPWLPRLRPFPGLAPARVYVASTCGVCDEVGQWILARSPVALEVDAAEGHPAGLRRMTYESADGRAQGVAAFARALEHLSLGWAWLGWFLLLPGVSPAVQLVVDGLGYGPQDLPEAAVGARPQDRRRPTGR